MSYSIHSSISALVPRNRGPQLQYEPEYCDLIKELAQEGKFPETWCCTIGVTKATLQQWCKRQPEFAEAWEIAWYLLADYWSTKVREAKNGAGEMPPNVLLEVVRKRFPDLYGQNPTGTQTGFLAENQSDTAPETGSVVDLSAENGTTTHERGESDTPQRAAQLERIRLLYERVNGERE